MTQEQIDLFIEYISGLDELVKEFADKMISWEDEIPTFDWSQALGYYQAAAEPVTAERQSTQASLVVACLHLIVSLKILRESGAEEVIDTETMLTGKEPDAEKIAEIIRERLENMKTERGKT